MYRPSHRPSLRLCMFSPRRAISVSSCSLDTHLTTYFVYLRFQLDFSWRTEQFAKSFGFCEVFSKAGWDHLYGFLLNSRYSHDKIIGECRQYYLKLVSSIFHVKDTFLLSQFSEIVPIKTTYLRYAVCGCCLCIKNANYYKYIPCHHAAAYSLHHEVLLHTQLLHDLLHLILARIQR